jgi:hypothetical protein
VIAVVSVWNKGGIDAYGDAFCWNQDCKQMGFRAGSSMYMDNVVLDPRRA